MNLSKSRTLEK